jgi:hypothetical protein
MGRGDAALRLRGRGRDRSSGQDSSERTNAKMWAHPMNLLRSSPLRARGLVWPPRLSLGDGRLLV